MTNIEKLGGVINLKFGISVHISRGHFSHHLSLPFQRKGFTKISDQYHRGTESMPVFTLFLFGLQSLILEVNFRRLRVLITL